MQFKQEILVLEIWQLRFRIIFRSTRLPELKQITLNSIAHHKYPKINTVFEFEEPEKKSLVVFQVAQSDNTCVEYNLSCYFALYQTWVIQKTKKQQLCLKMAPCFPHIIIYTLLLCLWLNIYLCVVNKERFNIRRCQHFLRWWWRKRSRRGRKWGIIIRWTNRINKSWWCSYSICNGDGW